MNTTLELDTKINNNKNEIKIDNLNNMNSNDYNYKPFINDSFSDLNLSDIGNKDKNSIQFSQRSHNLNTENEELNNYFFSKKRSSLGSVKLEDFNNLFMNENKKLKLTKEDLNNIPLPIFSCIYCSNEKIVFNHLLNEILSQKYLISTSVYDLKELTKIISYRYLVDKYDQNDKLEDIIIKNTEYINKYYIYNESKNILLSIGNDKIYCEIHKKKIISKIGNKLNNIKLKRIKKNLHKIPTIKKFNKYYSFNNNIFNNNINNNSSINNSTDEVFICNKKNNPNNQTILNLSSSNFNSVSLVNYIENNNPKEKENRFKLDDIIEQIEKNSHIEYSGFDLSRKITKEEIEWENEYYNIWTPKIEPLFIQYIPPTSKKIFNKNINKTFMKIQKRNKSFSKNGKIQNSNSKKKYTMVQSKEKEKENIIVNKSYQKNNRSKNKTEQISHDKIKNFKKFTITHLNTHSGSKNNKKNIFINLNINTSKKKKEVKNKINKHNLNKNIKSQKCLKQYSANMSLNFKKKINPINLFNSSKNINKLINNQVINHKIPLNITIVNKSSKIKKKTNKINFGKRINKSSNSKSKHYLNRNKINNIKFLSYNSSVTNKKTKKPEIINAFPKYFNKIKRNIINLTNKISRNNTYQNLENIKEKSVLININKDRSCDPPSDISTQTKTKLLTNSNVDNKSKKKIFKINKNIKVKEKNINNSIHNKKENYPGKLNYINDITNKKNIYNIKILDKKNIEIKTKYYGSKINLTKYK